jgi:hypothetical protein
VVIDNTICLEVVYSYIMMPLFFTIDDFIISEKDLIVTTEHIPFSFSADSDLLISSSKARSPIFAGMFETIKSYFSSGFSIPSYLTSLKSFILFNKQFSSVKFFVNRYNYYGFNIHLVLLVLFFCAN